MANLGYWQMKAFPGVWYLQIAPGRSSELYALKDDGDGGQETTLSKQITIDDLRGKLVHMEVTKEKGKEHEKLLASTDDASHSQEKKKGNQNSWNSNILKWASGFINGSDQSKKSKNTTMVTGGRHGKTINIFSVASGHFSSSFFLEVLMKDKEEELNTIIMELRKTIDALQEKCEKEESAKLETMDSFSREKEARDVAEKLQASVSEELKRSQQDSSSANQKIQSLNEMYKRSQEYNTSLQQYNSKLQSELASTNETLKRVEKEKAAVFENLSTLRGHYTSLQEQLSSSRDAHA